MSDPTAGRPEDLRAIPVRHPGRWAGAAVILVLVAMMINSIFFSTTVRGGKHQKRFELDVIRKYFWTAPIRHGVILTIELTVAAMAIGVVLGVILAVLRLSPNPLLSGASWMYIWFFRGTPVLVQLTFWYEISYLFPRLTLGIPFGPAFAHYNANTLVTPVFAAIVGLGLNEAAYMAEIVRAGIISVDEGQNEAAQSLGMRRVQTMRLVVLPQAMRVIVPPTGNETISMLKTTSLAATITVGEVFFQAQAIAARTYRVVPLLMVASIWYLLLTSVLTTGQYYVERYFARGATRELPPTPLQRLRARLAPRGPRGPRAAARPEPGAG